MRILLIDDSDVFRLQIRQILREAIPDAEIDSWDPVAYGKPGPSFDWRRYDLLLLLNGREYQALMTRAGKEALRAECLKTVQELLRRETGKAGVEDLYFTSFVVQ